MHRIARFQSDVHGTMRCSECGSKICRDRTYGSIRAAFSSDQDVIGIRSGQEMHCARDQIRQPHARMPLLGAGTLYLASERDRILEFGPHVRDHQDIAGLHRLAGTLGAGDVDTEHPAFPVGADALQSGFIREGIGQQAAGERDDVRDTRPALQFVDCGPLHRPADADGLTDRRYEQHIPGLQTQITRGIPV